MDELMQGITGQEDLQTAEADTLIDTMFYLLCKLETSECQYFGSRFLEEVTYINSFIHED